MKHVLVTGGLGFIGSHFVVFLLEKYKDYAVINLDANTYAGHVKNAAEAQASPRYRWIQGDISDTALLTRLFTDNHIDIVVHFAAESHVDRSIQNPYIFTQTNVLGTQCLLEAARIHGVERFIHISTDEVYGSLGPAGSFTEATSLAPNSPYSASKAASDLLSRAYYRTYGLPVIITRCSNNYGPKQMPEKWIPLVITKAIHDEQIPVYGDGRNVRDWIYVWDHCHAIDHVMRLGVPGEVYNVGANQERANIEVARMLLQKLGKSTRLLNFVPDRPGHDLRYSIDSAKLRKLTGWRPVYTFEQGLDETIQWYLSHADWWD